MVTRYEECDCADTGEPVGVIPCPDGRFVEYSDYAALQAENERLKEKVSVTMGVGSGGGNSFVHGDCDSIKVLQGKLLEMERLRSDNERLKAGWVDLEQFRKAARAYLLVSHAGLNDCEAHGVKNHGFMEEIEDGERLLALIDAHKGE